MKDRRRVINGGGSDVDVDDGKSNKSSGSGRAWKCPYVFHSPVPIPSHPIPIPCNAIIKEHLAGCGVLGRQLCGAFSRSSNLN